jgi:hypothetical protein
MASIMTLRKQIIVLLGKPLCQESTHPLLGFLDGELTEVKAGTQPLEMIP